MHCKCDACSPDPDPNWTRAHLIRCLAEYIAGLSGRDARRAWLSRWEARHGQASARILREAVAEAWNARKRKAAR